MLYCYYSGESINDTEGLFFYYRNTFNNKKIIFMKKKFLKNRDVLRYFPLAGQFSDQPG